MGNLGIGVRWSGDVILAVEHLLGHLANRVKYVACTNPSQIPLVSSMQVRLYQISSALPHNEIFGNSMRKYPQLAIFSLLITIAPQCHRPGRQTICQSKDRLS